MYPNIEAERARNGLTITQLASLLGVSRKSYYNWRIKGKIPQNKLLKMADIFGVPVDYLLVQKESKSAQRQKGKIEMNEIKIFENTEFGSVRAIAIEGEPYFVGKDVAEILAYANPRKAIIDHVDEEDKTDGVTIRDSPHWKK